MSGILKAIGSHRLGGSQPFTVVRTSYNNGKKAINKIEGKGNILPASHEQLEQLPEKDKLNQVLALITTMPLQLGENQGATRTEKDRVIYQGDVYNVVALENWGHFGFYNALVHWIAKEGG